MISFRQEQRKVNKEYSSYNFEEAEYVNEKRKIENSHPLPHVKLQQVIHPKSFLGELRDERKTSHASQICWPQAGRRRANRTNEFEGIKEE